MANYVLYHHGVKGMKWGRRREQLNSAKQQYRKRTDKAFDEYERTIAKIEKPYKRGQNLSKADMDREAAAEKKYSDAVAKAKSDYKSTKKSIKTNSKNDKGFINEYQKERNRQKKHIVTKRSIDVGTAVVNRYLAAHNTTVNGNPLRVSSGVNAIVKRVLDYKYMKDTFK